MPSNLMMKELDKTQIKRNYKENIIVKLECSYQQVFCFDLIDDATLIEMTKNMQKLNIPSCNYDSEI